MRAVGRPIGEETTTTLRDEAGKFLFALMFRRADVSPMDFVTEWFTRIVEHDRMRQQDSALPDYEWCLHSSSPIYDPTPDEGTAC